MKIRKTTFEAEQQEKDDFLLKMTPSERLAHHVRLLQRIYGDRFNQPLPPEARVVRKVKP